MLTAEISAIAPALYAVSGGAPLTLNPIDVIGLV